MPPVLRSLVFNALFYVWTTLACFGLLWTLIVPRRLMVAAVCWYLHSVAWLERWLLGIDYRVLGREHLPAGPMIVAAKHQSAWETMKLNLLLDDPAIVLKHELMRIPIWGWYAAKAEMIPVDRGAGSRAVSGMLAAARRAAADGRPIVIFPQGTRTAPGTRRPYRIGVGALYQELGLPIVPMALNSGLYWPRRRFLKRPGTITVEFLEPIPPGLERAAAMAMLEERLEAASDRLASGGAQDAAIPGSAALHAKVRR